MADKTTLDDRKLQEQASALAKCLEAGDLPAFEQRLTEYESIPLLVTMRRKKTFGRATRDIADAALTLIVAAADRLLPAEEAEEYARYLHLSLAVRAARATVDAYIPQVLRRMPKLSLRQLIHVATRVARASTPRAVDPSSAGPSPGEVAEYARRVHELSGATNDLWFGIARAINLAATVVGPRDLQRADAIEKARAPFSALATLASQLNALEYAHDSASFGDFIVAEHDPAENMFRMDIADVRRALLRTLSIRRRLMYVLSGRRNDRFVREQLREGCDGVVHNALGRYSERVGGRAEFTKAGLEHLSTIQEDLLLFVDAEDDLLWTASSDRERMSMLYHLSVAMRLNAAVADMIFSNLPARARKENDDSIRLDDLIEVLGRTDHKEIAEAAWTDLTVDLPARSHWDLIRKPFLRMTPGSARALTIATGDNWPIVAREMLNKGGETGRLYGARWEEFYAKPFENSGWTILSRNLDIKVGKESLTEVDLLLLKDDLLLAVEVKALTGSGLNPYDHWKNRQIIEKGCRQAKLAADYLRDHPEFVASVSSTKIADQIKHVQPLVLTTESMFDGWEYLDVPVAGETIRKAITVGTTVDYYTGDGKVVRSDTHLKKEDLTTEAILKALRDPIELKLAPEKGEVRHIPVTVASLRMLVPDTGLPEGLGLAGETGPG